MYLLYAYALAGRPEAVPLLADVAGEPIPEPSIFLYPCWLTWLAEVHHRLGRSNDAAKFADKALTLARARGERGHEAWALRLSGDLAVADADRKPEEAERHYAAALASARALGMLPLEAYCRLGLAKVHERAGRSAAATEEAHAAHELAARLGIRLDVVDSRRTRRAPEGQRKKH
jgi:tetratricopeptide (TPR) repeat protein